MLDLLEMWLPRDRQSERNRPERRRPIRLAVALGVACCLLAPGAAFALAGDFDGDSVIGPADEALLAGLYGSKQGDSRYDPSADLDANGRIDVGDLAIFGAAFGASQGIGDVTPPVAIPSLNDIPDDMNDLLVAPPDGFQITFELKSLGGSLIDTSSLEVTSALDMGPYPAGTDLAPLFDVSPTRAAWEVPPGTDLDRTTHTVWMRVRDLAGNETQKEYSFAVRNFPFGQPLASTQIFFLDFDTDRGFGTFTDDLRSHGLLPQVNVEYDALIRDLLITEILHRVRRAYGLNDDGTPGADAVNIVFTTIDPGGPRNRLCIGGASPQTSTTLGLATTDVDNLDETTDECAVGAQFGVFPQAIEALWGDETSYLEAFNDVDPDLGGTPIGDDVQDPLLITGNFNHESPTLAQLTRINEVLPAALDFAQIIAVAIAHETGHMLGLTAPGAAPAGLYGGTYGGKLNHNVNPSGSTPGPNYIMNPGGSFSFDEITGTHGYEVPRFRAMNWAYLRDRLALSEQVTGLYPPPELWAVSPNPVTFPQGQTRTLTFTGDGFVDPPLIDLVPVAGGFPVAVLNVSLVDAQTLTGTVNKFLTPAGVYDVYLVNGDGQETVLPEGVVVQ